MGNEGRKERRCWALAFFLGWLVLAGTTAAAIEVTRGPYLQMGGHDRITIRWRTDLPVGSRVDFGTPESGLTQTVETLDATMDHIVELTDLDYSQRYDYAVGTPAEILVGDDGTHFFVTAPLPGLASSTRIWILGDSGSGNVSAQEVRDAYYAFAGNRHTDLWLMLGDNAYPSGTDQEYQDKLFDWFPEMLRKSVLWPTLGNHDAVSADSPTQSGVYYDVFSLPSQAEVGGVASGTEAYYSFDFGAIHFVVLDSQDTYRLAGGGMINWLEADLAATAQDWIIAIWHHPPYSKGSHDSDVEVNLLEMRENAVPILDDYGVDLTLTGHSHSYERSYPIDGHYGDSTTYDPLTMRLDAGDGDENGNGAYTKPVAGPNPHGGIVHTVAGSGSIIGGGILDHPVMFSSMNVHGSVVLDIDGPRLDVAFLSRNGVIMDQFTVVKGQLPGAPIVDFSAFPIAGQMPLVVSFLDASSNDPTLWEWDTDGDGSIDSLQVSPVRIYDQPGVYDVTLSVANVSGTDQLTRANFVCVTSGIPQPILNLRFTTSSALQWDGVPDALSYQLLRGDLDSLRVSGGDFAAAGIVCSAEELSLPSAAVAGQPPVGTGWFYLARGKNCALQQGSWDSAGSGQQASRDPEFVLAAGVCGCSLAFDADGDAICDVEDICPADPLNDADDFDGICADVDNCPMVANTAQLNGDGDLLGDLCDACPNDALNDADVDGLCANLDNCPATANASQIDQDADMLGDACDACPFDAANDIDGDGSCGDVDNCPDISNSTQLDTDGDSLGDACDICPVDMENDADADLVCEDVDNCDIFPNSLQRDDDLDGIGNVCDICPGISDVQQSDSDGDGVGDLCDCDLNRSDRVNPIAVTLAAQRLGAQDLRLVWAVAPGADRWTVSRNTVGLGFSNYGPCIEPDLIAPQADDIEMPPVGGVFFYQVQAWNDSCGPGSLGFSSAEILRKNLNPMACGAP